LALRDGHCLSTGPPCKGHSAASRNRNDYGAGDGDSKHWVRGWDRTWFSDPEKIQKSCMIIRGHSYDVGARRGWVPSGWACENTRGRRGFMPAHVSGVRGCFVIRVRRLWILTPPGDNSPTRKGREWWPPPRPPPFGMKLPANGCREVIRGGTPDLWHGREYRNATSWRIGWPREEIKRQSGGGVREPEANAGKI